jgi:hypothetical protein
MPFFHCQIKAKYPKPQKTTAPHHQKRHHQKYPSFFITPTKNHHHRQEKNIKNTDKNATFHRTFSFSILQNPLPHKEKPPAPLTRRNDTAQPKNPPKPSKTLQN